MRLHTNKIDATHIHEATRNLPGVKAEWTMHGSRSHERGFEVRLTGNGTHAGYATKDHQGATWDEWGVFIAALYEIDPHAMWGRVKAPVYRDSPDFHFLTDWRFSDPAAGLPGDTHKRHNWHADYPHTQLGYSYCTKCSAEKRTHY